MNEIKPCLSMPWDQIRYLPGPYVEEVHNAIVSNSSIIGGAMSMPDQIERGIVSWKWTNIAEAQELLNMLISRSRDQVARLPAVRGDMKKMYVESMGTEMVCLIQHAIVKGC